MVIMSRIVNPHTHTHTVQRTTSSLCVSLLHLSSLFLSLFRYSSSSSLLPTPSPIQPPLYLPTSFSLSVVADLIREVCLYAREFHFL
jgi:hypothetical protein